MSNLKEIDLTGLVDQMCQSMLGVGVTEGADPVEGDLRQVVGCVHLTGPDWVGSILVAMPDAAADAATAAMFMLGPDEVEADLVADAMGEFANVLAGMTKTAIGGGCQLSLPSVTSGRSLKVVIPGAEMVEQQCYATDLGRITVTTLVGK